MKPFFVIGVDLGTSGVKAVLVSEGGGLIAEASAALEVSRPQPLWAEQVPADWLDATDKVMQSLRLQVEPVDWQSVRAISVSGQMHGAVLLDSEGSVLRPAILWNDGRSQVQCAELETREPATRQITANRAMAGFTAPKLMWVAANEPATFDRVDKVVLPKDWLVWQLTGVIGTDCSDAAGTLWLDVSKRVWSEAMLTASGMRLNQMPRLHEGSERVGCLLQHWASHWGLSSDVVVAAGAGDNAGGAVGVGVVHPGEGLISLGTSGVIFVATDGPQANPQRGVHTFCHALPNMWHQMAVLLSASSALSWWCNICGLEPAKILAMLPLGEVREGAPLFLPYLSGERTPHADPGATGSFHGLTHLHNRDDMSYAVLEGVAFAFADGMDALREAGSDPKRLLAIGGGARSDTWLQLLADVLCIQIDRPAGSDVGPALGAARLALLSMGIPFDDVMRPPSLAKSFYADAGRSAALQQRLTRYRSAYAPLRALSIY